MSEKGNSNLEQAFNSLNAFFIREKQNHMIIYLDHRIVVRNDHFLATDDRTNRRTFRQLDFIYGPAHHLGTATVPVRNRLNRFCSATPQ
jgi:hypothetical protein